MTERPHLVLVGTSPPSLLRRFAALADDAELHHAQDAEEARTLLAGALSEGRERQAEGEDGGAARFVLRRVRATVTEIHHDANNPLAIIAGNAQLLLELGRVSGLDDELLQPIRDIEEASVRLADVLGRLVDLRDQL